MPRRKRSRFSGGRERPLGITIISILEIIGAIYLFLAAAALSTVSLFSLGFLLGAVSGFGSLVLLILGIVLLLSAYGLWYGKRWAWWLELAVSGIMILSVAVLNIVGFVVGLMLVYYLTRNYVKKWFMV